MIQRVRTLEAAQACRIVLDALTEGLPASVADRPFGRDVETLRDRLSAQHCEPRIVR
jgi:hypothetical protein